MSYRYERYRERPRQQRGCLVTAVILVWVILGALLLYNFVGRRAVTNFLQERIASRLAIPRPADPSTDPPSGEEGVAVLPESAQPGSFSISNDQANQWLEDHRAELRGIDDVRMRFTPGEVQADVTVGGVTSTARAGAQVQDGMIVVTNARLDPPLGYVVDIQPFADLIQQRLNNDLATTGRTVTGVTIEQGQMTITLE